MRRALWGLLSLVFLVGCESPLLSGESTSAHRAAKSAVSSELFFSSLNRRLVFVWLEGPFGNPTQASSFEILLVDQGGRLSSPEELEFELSSWAAMPYMGGHGPADDGFIENLGGGRFRGQELYFNMPGYWELNLQVWIWKNGVRELAEEISLSFDF